MRIFQRGIVWVFLYLLNHSHPDSFIQVSRYAAAPARHQAQILKIWMVDCRTCSGCLFFMPNRRTCGIGMAGSERSDEGKGGKKMEGISETATPLIIGRRCVSEREKLWMVCVYVRTTLHSRQKATCKQDQVRLRGTNESFGRCEGEETGIRYRTRKLGMVVCMYGTGRLDQSEGRGVEWFRGRV
ncbi:hypothetical protein BDP55DRAFT_647327 [Colletotrichum godetiae]|uniref:Secreted protein n=1 Tax=Colletotrichum godetiae TaxID=1209918 RepID=A0AAJ0F1B1_9PEZI|nr:uncharacterized protein BDP55DRAFT_647327 [Colletotrichum godetiae]KAK1691526.1 hypothetical protein BDP55DRAFT_647327 [Colletotrichum godetiae]